MIENGMLIDEIVYPYTDGQPLGESVLQHKWILFLFGNLSYLYRDREDVFVGGNNFIYPIQGNPEIVTAPDIYIAHGRPKQDELLSYKIWEQNNIYPQVAIEILSKSNTATDREARRIFHQTYGAKEYIEINPRTQSVAAWVRRRGQLRSVKIVTEWTSPLMGIRFVQGGDRLAIYFPDGTLFRSHEVILQSEVEKDRLARKLKRATRRAEKQAEAERIRADAETLRADAQTQRADATELANAQLLEKLRKMGIDPETL